MAAKDSIMTTLRKSGYKATPPRIAILEIFNKLKQPLSAQEIITLLPRSGGTGYKNIDQATIYRTLNSFKTKGLIRQIDLRHNHAHYELANLKEHHHLICLRCGRIEDVHRCDVENLESAILRETKHFAEIKQHALEFYGVCKVCERKSTGTEIIAHKRAPK